MRYFLFIIFFSYTGINAYSQNWVSVGNFANPNVTDIRVLFNDTIEDKLFIGGSFNHVNYMKAYSIVSYNGTSFDTLSNENMLGQIVVEIAKFNNIIYIGGFLDCVPSYQHCGVFYFENNSWIPCGGGINGNIQLLYQLDTTLLIGGLLQYIQNSDTNYALISWNGNVCRSGWDNALNDNDNSITSAYIWHDTLYIGGNFDLPHGVEEIAFWDGQKWSNMENGILGNGWVNSIIEYKEDLYVGGYFTKSTGNVDNCIQRWDGCHWCEVGGGVSGGQILDMAVFNDELYVVGQFSYAGGVPAKYIAKWDGINWCGFGDNFDNIIETIEVFHNDLYIGGGFKKINSDSIYLFAKWIGDNYIDTCGNTASIHEIENEESTIIVYPNPFSENTTLQFTKPAYNATLSIYDILGKEVFRMQNINEKEIKISRDGMCKGMYFFKILEGSGIVGQGKFIVE